MSEQHWDYTYQDEENDIEISRSQEGPVKRKNRRKKESVLSEYGYIELLDKTHRLIIDQYPALIVTEIFNMRLDGMSPTAIANQLNEMHIFSPKEYKKIKEYTSSRVLKNPKLILWGRTTVTNILKNQIYVDNTFNPIIDKYVFDVIQKSLRRELKVSSKEGVVSPLTGLVYCADCGMPMMKESTKAKKKTYHAYVCKGYKKKMCTSHRIDVELLHKMILEDIHKHMDEILELSIFKEHLDSNKMREDDKKALAFRIKTQKKEEQILVSKAYPEEESDRKILKEARYKDLKAYYLERINFVGKAIAESEKEYQSVCPCVVGLLSQ